MLDYLREGNRRFVNNQPLAKDYYQERDQLKNGQNPHAVIVTCSDSRIPVGHIFDEAFGKFFVIRTAGNIIDTIELGSIEFAVGELNTSLLLILGHRKCGAIQVAIDDYPLHSKNLDAIIEKVKPAVTEAKVHHNNYDDVWEDAIKRNVLNQVDYILENSIIVKNLADENKLKIITGIYDIETGVVEFINCTNQ